jgi:tRNA A37 threonylcarbamoyladenosine synthetase subunit TsaC/SUA5/YrdC
VPGHPVPQALLAELNEPIMSSTLLLPGMELPLSEPEEIHAALAGRVDLFIESGPGGVVPSTVVDLTSGYPVLVRAGKGDSRDFR